MTDETKAPGAEESVGTEGTGATEQTGTTQEEGTGAAAPISDTTATGGVSTDATDSSAGSTDQTGTASNGSTQADSAKEVAKTDTPLASAQVIKPTAAVVQSTEVLATTATIQDTTAAAAAPAVSNFDRLMEKSQKEGSAKTKQLIAYLETYVEKMKPRVPIKAIDASVHQQGLWSVIREVIENPDNTEFRAQWFILLAFFEKHKEGALGGRYVFRFAEMWNKGVEQLDVFQRILNLLHLTSDFENRAEGIKQVDLARTLGEFSTEQFRSRLINYYKT